MVAGLGRPVGLVLVLAIIAYVLLSYHQEKRATGHGAIYDKAAALEGLDPGVEVVPDRSNHLGNAVVLFTAGLGLIIGGGSLLVDAAVDIASDLGVTDEVIGLTVVAVGTSLPELVTSAIAALKRQGEIALGNVLGANIYNIFFIGGVTGIVAPTPIPSSILSFDLPVLLVISVLVMVFSYTGGRLRRSEGVVLVAAYVAYASVVAGLI